MGKKREKDRVTRGLFECPDCHYRFENQKDLNEHMDEKQGGCPERDERDEEE